MGNRVKGKKVHTWMRKSVLARLVKYCESTGLTRPAAIERALEKLFEETANATRSN